eukprot:CAMPEP_0117506170 /NCGR_PEP_ID=MMETSP0784-20121206/25767_1 /TAXON_ID=39447 /ORGANISM="" /LENGTH=103 /DNA_ID=CAMNT_0005301629 /DNA_START=604 /DNA_END=913 /DNA_ORIENTATION=-
MAGLAPSTRFLSIVSVGIALRWKVGCATTDRCNPAHLNAVKDSLIKSHMRAARDLVLGLAAPDATARKHLLRKQDHVRRWRPRQRTLIMAWVISTPGNGTPLE